jgi:hypothetical protein
MLHNTPRAYDYNQGVYVPIQARMEPEPMHQNLNSLSAVISQYCFCGIDMDNGLGMKTSTIMIWY